ncbi:MAG: hypothetical protein M1813_000224 [Trichoglossum hirsutum]|nr:MAG: hypothetical protein M1813_000224 [Trichoglossum hirsutum]
MASSYALLRGPGSLEGTLGPPPQFPGPHYDFRPSARLAKRVVSTWFDNDESGTYDPKGKGELTPPSKRSRETSSEADKAANDDQPKKTRPNSWLRGRQQGGSLLVTLGFKSDRGKAIVSTYANTANEAVDEKERPNSSYEEHFETPEAEISSHHIPLATRPRSRRTHKLSGILTDPPSGFSISQPLQNTPTVDLSDFSLGHPESRGCKACFELRIPCPLLEDDSTYPCDNCVEDDCDCELIIPPARKRACENCRKSRVKCSYREGGDHSFACENCQRKGQKCFAGPDTSNDKLPSGVARFKSTPERPCLTCTPCRKGKKWCSLKTRGTEPPCKGCLRGGLECRFERVERHKDQAAAQRKTEAQSTERSPEVQTPTPVPIPDASRECGVRMTIKTAFAHPITLNHCPAEDGSDPCHWCDVAAFGIMGIGAVEVEVIRWQDGRGYTEISGGHAGAGVEPSRMCFLCTMERMLICNCEDHTIHPLPNRDPGDFDFEAAFQELLSDQCSQGTNRSLWCSVCPSPAFFECRTPQELDLQVDEIVQSPPMAFGCGLLLCETCEQLLTNQYKGDLQAMVSNVESNLHDFPAGLRADVSFLLDEGELMRRMRASATTAEV